MFKSVEIKDTETYYIFNDEVFKYKEDIIERELPESILDDEISDWEPEGIEEVSGEELKNRLEEELLWINF